MYRKRQWNAAKISGPLADLKGKGPRRTAREALKRTSAPAVVLEKKRGGEGSKKKRQEGTVQYFERKAFGNLLRASGKYAHNDMIVTAQDWKRGTPEPFSIS